MSSDAERIQVALDMYRLYEKTERRDEMYGELCAVVGSIRREHAAKRQRAEEQHVG